MSTIVNVPKETATATSGCVRRHGRGPRTASTVEQQQRARRQVLAKHHFHHGPADQCGDQGPVPRPPVRGIRGSRFGPQRAECVGGHLISLVSPRDRRIRRKYKSSAVPTARSNQTPGLMCQPPASVKGGKHPPDQGKEQSDENTSIPHRTSKSAVPQRAGRSAHARAGQTRSSMDQLHVPLHLRRLPRPVQPGFLDEILAGMVHEFDTGPTFVALVLTLMAIPILMILLSTTLPARVNRTINLVVARSTSPSRCTTWQGGVLELLLLLRPLHRTRGAAPGLHPALRLDLATPHRTAVDPGSQPRQRATSHAAAGVTARPAPDHPSLAPPPGTVTWPIVRC